MERELPTYEIGDTTYIIDVDFNLLRHPKLENVAYDFFNHMEDRGNYYRLCIDALTLQPLVPANQNNYIGVLTFDIPHMVKLDPQGVAEKYALPLATLPDSDRQLRNNEDLMYRREIGKPAAITIGSSQFFVDTAGGYLITAGTSSKDWLNTNTMEVDHFRTGYRLLYDPAGRKEVRRSKGDPLPEGVLAVEIPHIRFSDSYNYRRHNLEAISHRLSMEEYFRRFPVRSNMAARIVPIEKLGYLNKGPGQQEDLEKQVSKGHMKEASAQQDPQEIKKKMRR